MNDYFLSSRPAYPWSVYPVGLPALAVVAALLVVFTIWTYLGHPQATRRRVTIVLALRLAALAVTLLTAVRPSVGVNENPKQPAVLLVGVDVSESMTVRDEVGGQARIDAVRKQLDKCQPLFDDLLAEHAITTVIYKFGSPEFNEATDRWTPATPADARRSFYGAYLSRTYDRWQTEPRVRAHLVIGDGIDNDETFVAAAEAAKFGRRGVPVHTFLTGSETANPEAKDVAVVGVECLPSPAFIKNDVLVTARVNAFGFKDARVTMRVSYFHDGKERAWNEEFTLDRERGNEIKMTIKAPDTKGEIKVKAEVGLEKDGKIEPLPGELSPLNNWSETYLTVNKEGVRVLIVDQLRWEETLIRDALRREKRFDVYEVIRQTDLNPSPAEKDLLDLDKHAYDVVIVGNVSAAHLDKAAPGFLDRLADQIRKKGLGVMFLGGEFAYQGFRADVMPVTAEKAPRDPDKPNEPDKSLIVDRLSGGTLPDYPVLPTQSGLEKMFRVAATPKESERKWDQMNGAVDGKGPKGESLHPARMTGFNRLKVPELVGRTYAVYAHTIDHSQRLGPSLQQVGEDLAKDVNARKLKMEPLLIGSQQNDKGGRWLAFGGFDTYLWRTHGQPKLNDGLEMHERFWRQCVLWLAHQDTEESQVYARPKFRQLKVTGQQEVEVGVKKPDGTDDPEAPLTVRIVPLAPGLSEPKPEDVKKATPLTLLPDKKGRKVVFRAPAPGEYFVAATSERKDDKGATVELRGTAKFIAVPDVSDEMLQVNASPDRMRQLSVPTGGKALLLEELPGFLQELKSLAPPDAGKKPRYYPDWNRNRSKGFLPLWLLVFALLLGAEWGLRRLWGMV